MLEVNPYLFVVIVLATLAAGFAVGVSLMIMSHRRDGSRLDQVCRSAKEMLEHADEEYRKLILSNGSYTMHVINVLQEELKFSYGRNWRKDALIMGGKFSQEQVDQVMGSVGMQDGPIRPRIPMRTPEQQAALGRRKRLQDMIGEPPRTESSGHAKNNSDEHGQ